VEESPVIIELEEELEKDDLGKIHKKFGDSVAVNAE
jgi:hypothetical protein